MQRGASWQLTVDAALVSLSLKPAPWLHAAIIAVARSCTVTLERRLRSRVPTAVLRAGSSRPQRGRRQWVWVPSCACCAGAPLAKRRMIASMIFASASVNCTSSPCSAFLSLRRKRSRR